MTGVSDQSYRLVRTSPSSVKSANVRVPAGQGEFSAVGFSYGGPAENSHTGSSGPVEDLGEEGCSDSESGQYIFSTLLLKASAFYLVLIKL